MKACWVVDDGQVEQSADDVVAQYSRLPAGGAFIDGLGFDDDDISVRLHSRSLVVGGWFRCPFPAKLRALVSCATPDPRRAHQCTLKPEEPLNGGISKDFSPNFTPNRFQTGRLSRFGVKCRLFGGERGWRAHQRPPTPTNASQSQSSHGYGKRPTPHSATPEPPAN
ncbi:hypothetical protein FRC0360_00249 [Corynebacterium diphtheriae]|nr:hypothetical protein FRC0360_00249 [Corynebacterium diphtheriae]